MGNDLWVQGSPLSPLIPHMINEGFFATRVIAAKFHAQLETAEFFWCTSAIIKFILKFINDDLVILLLLLFLSATFLHFSAKKKKLFVFKEHSFCNFF